MTVDTCLCLATLFPTCLQLGSCTVLDLSTLVTVKLVVLITVCAHPLACHCVPHASPCWGDTLYYDRSFDFLVGLFSSVYE